MPLIYEETFRVLQYECDAWNRMTPGAVLRRTQEVSISHCNSIGMTQEHYRKTGTAFLLSATSLQVERMPVFEECVRIQTRAYAMRRAIYQRVTSIFSEQGDVICEADTRWVLVDTNTRHILRKEPEGFSPFTDVESKEAHAMKMPKPLHELKNEELYATYTLCDSNGHINNARYADLVCDMLPIEKLERGPVKKMLLSYKSEIPLGSSFSLACSTAEEETGYCFLAHQQGKKNFECYVAF